MNNRGKNRPYMGWRTLVALPAMLACLNATPSLAQAAPSNTVLSAEPIISSFHHETCNENAECGISIINVAILAFPMMGSIEPKSPVQINITISNSGPHMARNIPLQLGLADVYDCDSNRDAEVFSSDVEIRPYRIGEIIGSSTMIEQIDLGQSVTFSFQCQAV